MFTLKLSKTLSLSAALTVTICTKTNADGFSLHQFPLTLDDGQYIWLLPATVPP